MSREKEKEGRGNRREEVEKTERERKGPGVLASVITVQSYVCTVASTTVGNL